MAGAPVPWPNLPLATVALRGELVRTVVRLESCFLLGEESRNSEGGAPVFCRDSLASYAQLRSTFRKVVEVREVRAALVVVLEGNLVCEREVNLVDRLPLLGKEARVLERCRLQQARLISRRSLNVVKLVAANLNSFFLGRHPLVLSV